MPSYSCIVFEAVIRNLAITPVLLLSKTKNVLNALLAVYRYNLE